MSPKLERPIVCLISSGELKNENFLKTQKEAVNFFDIAARSGVSIIQIREKQLSAKNLSLLTRSAVTAARGTKTKILVNERFDIALSCNADGVHLPSDAMSVAVVRRFVPDHFLIGVSTHSESEVSTAFIGGADFAVFGPVFETPTKTGPVGLEKLNEICHKFKEFTILALGGIDESNIDQVLDSEAAGCAAIRYLNNAEALSSIAERFNR